MAGRELFFLITAPIQDLPPSLVILLAGATLLFTTLFTSLCLKYSQTAGAHHAVAPTQQIASAVQDS